MVILGYYFITPEAANRIFDVLIEHAGASEDEREKFVTDINAVQERYFSGKFGDGTRFYNTIIGWGVACSPGTDMDQCADAMDTVNKALNELLKGFKPERPKF